jgi:tetratricopeptide (TPR) repeat protein
LDNEPIRFPFGDRTTFDFGASEQEDEPTMDSERSDQHREDIAALLEQALSLDKENQYEEMLVIAEEAYASDPGSALALACKARALQKLERISEATIANDQALLLDTNLALAWINRSGLQLLQQKFPEALRSADRAIELAPNDTRAWANRGMALLNLNNLPGALEAMNLSLSLEPDFLFAMHMKGEILRQLGRLREVIPLMEHVLKLQPPDEHTLSLLVLARRSIEDYDGLPVLTQRLVEIAPDSLFGWDSHMRTLRALGRFEEASAPIDHLLELFPNDERILTIKADNLFRLGNYRESARVAKRALYFDVTYHPAKRIHEKALRLMYQRKVKRHKP